MAVKKKAEKTGSLAERLVKATKTKHSSVLTNSEFYGDSEQITTEIPLLNIALGGEVDAGIEPGVITIAGPSKHFKTSYGLKMCKAFQDKYEDGLIIYIDSEFGSPPKYLSKFGLDTDRIIHIPIDTVEALKTEAVRQLNEIERGDHVMMFIDSAGGLGSEKEISDAESGDIKVDFTRAKELNSFYRIVIPKVNMRSIPCVVINHTYKTIEMFAKDKLKGGEGGIYASNVIWFIGRSQDTNGQSGKNKEHYGYTFTIKIDKSRYIREGSTFPITVHWDKGILKYSGMGELAEEFGILETGKIGHKGAWLYADRDTGEELKILKDDAMMDDEWWERILKQTNIKELIKEKYLI
jgi:RecA/RadA recombinase